MDKNYFPLNKIVIPYKYKLIKLIYFEYYIIFKNKYKEKVKIGMQRLPSGCTF